MCVASLSPFWRSPTSAARYNFQTIATGVGRVLFIRSQLLVAHNINTYYHRITYVVQCIYHSVGFHMCSVGRCEYVCYYLISSRADEIGKFKKCLRNVRGFVFVLHLESKNTSFEN